MKNIFKEKSKKRTVIVIAAAVAVVMAGAAAVYAVNAADNKAEAKEVKIENAITDKVFEHNHGVNEYYAEHNIPMDADLAEDIGIEKAKEIALAQVEGAKTSHIVKAEPDHDDGMIEYDIEIKYQGYEYEFEIDAATGKILGSDVDDCDNDCDEHGNHHYRD